MDKNKKRITVLCWSCKREFGITLEPKGVQLKTCPFCGCELKIEFEENRTVDIYKSKRVK